MSNENSPSAPRSRRESSPAETERRAWIAEQARSSMNILCAFADDLVKHLDRDGLDPTVICDPKGWLLTRTMLESQNSPQELRYAQVCMMLEDAKFYAAEHVDLLVRQQDAWRALGAANHAWTSLVIAQELGGMKHGAVLSRLQDERVELAIKEALSAKGRAGAKKSHAENYAIKRQAFEWLDANAAKYRSIEATAAGLVAARLAPIKHRTARIYASEHRKLQSAGKL